MHSNVGSGRVPGHAEDGLYEQRGPLAELGISSLIPVNNSGQICCIPGYLEEERLRDEGDS